MAEVDENFGQAEESDEDDGVRNDLYCATACDT